MSATCPTACAPPDSAPRRGAPGLAASLVVALAPKCPACMAAHAGVLAWLGVDALVPARAVLPLLLAAGAVAVAVLARGARGRRGYGPALLGALGTAIAALAYLAGRAAHVEPHLHHVAAGALSEPAALAGWAGAALLAAAALWNAWPRSAPRP